LRSLRHRGEDAGGVDIAATSEVGPEIKADIATPEAWEQIERSRPDVLIHLAASSGIGCSPDDIAHNNIVGTYLAAAWCGLHRVPIVFASSGAVCNVDGPWWSLYGQSKADGERAVDHFCDGVGYAICRFSNVYGPQRAPKAVVGMWIDAIGKDEPLRIHGSGNQARDFVHVNDICEGLIAAAAVAAQGQPVRVDLCTGRPTSIRELFLTMAGVCNKPLRLVMDKDSREGAAEPLTRPEGAKVTLGWEAKISLPEGLRQMLRSHGLPVNDPA
jgi:nucleoside-diphosphate-sugar epimerase